MASKREDSIPHELRTAAEPRQQGLYPVRLARVKQVNPSVRLLQFSIPVDKNPNETTEQPFTFKPGQWLDVHIPSIANAGGFTITSTPADASSSSPYVELAVQDSPSNPPAAWLWKPSEEIIDQQVNIRVGGSFTWPPAGIDSGLVKNVLLVAGGVGINPLISILSHLNNDQQARQLNVHFLYSSRLPQDHGSASLDAILDQILFLSRIREVICTQKDSKRLNISLNLFLTDLSPGRFPSESTDLTINTRRISQKDLEAAAGDENTRKETVAYVCGPPAMTDELVDVLQGMLGDKKKVFYEKWW